MPWYVQSLSLFGFACLAFSLLALIGGRANLRNWWGVVLLASVFTSGMGTIGFYSNENHAKAQAAVRHQIETKYQVILDKDAVLPEGPRDQARTLVARVGGQVRQCTVQIVNKEPFVFCGGGVEADRR